MQKKKKVAIFDVDGTIFRSSLLIEVTEALIEEGIFPEKVKKIYAKSFNAWLNRTDSYDEYIMDVVKAFEKNIVDVKQTDFARVVKKVIALHKNKVYRYTRDLVKELKKKHYFLLAISHSPRELVYQFCKNLGFDKVYARIYEVGEVGTFTGNTLHVDLISNKANILRRFIEKENLSLADSFGVGDSESDINFLTFVDNPICFNPNSKLYAHAKKAGWGVVVERKDVIYKIN
ncbi:MAG: HAD-IB family hydrolase [bacterium]|nr:HAD-IB family hydrolase [bacterium]